MTKILSLSTCINGIILVRVALAEAHTPYLLASSWPHSIAVLLVFPWCWPLQSTRVFLGNWVVLSPIASP